MKGVRKRKMKLNLCQKKHFQGKRLLVKYKKTRILKLLRINFSLAMAILVLRQIVLELKHLVKTKNFRRPRAH